MCGFVMLALPCEVMGALRRELPPSGAPECRRPSLRLESPDPMSLSPGSRVGPYEIVSRLGAGGMGEVWKARDTRLDRSVAVKILPSQLASDAQLKLRFEREARTISQLEHPHICRLYDVGQAVIPAAAGDVLLRADGSADQEISYLVMELLDGESLADRLARGPLPLAEVLKLGAEIAEALAVAHRAGVIHRDLKPGNIMITKGGAKLLDFGLAKASGAFSMRPAQQSGGSAAGSATDAASTHLRMTDARPLTAEGTILGTFQYMSPEQLEALEADERSDIFALGCVLYEMLTGRRAFDGRTRTSLIAAIVAGTPRPAAELQPLTPPQLEHVITTCLEKDPDHRWQSAQDIAHELRWIAAAPDAPRAQRRSRRGLALTVAGIVAALAIGAAAGRLLSPPAPAEVVHATVAPPEGVQLVRPSGDGDAFALAPDGHSLVFVGREENGKRRLWLRGLASREARPMEGTEGATYPFWSHDGRWIAFFSNGKLRKVALDGSVPVAICDVASSPLGGDWSEDGVILFSPASGAGLHRVSENGGKSEAVTELDRKGGESTHRWARFLPGGTSFLYTAAAHEAPVTSEANAVYYARLGSPERKLVLRTRFNVEYVNGHLLFVRGETLVAQKFDAASGDLREEPKPLISNVHTSRDSFLAAFSAKGDTIAYSVAAEERKSEFVWFDSEGRETGSVLPPGSYSYSALSPDGSRLAVEIDDPASGPDIWIQDLTRNALTRLTLGGSGSTPVWSPDGRRIAYTSSENLVLVKEVDRDMEPQTLWRREGWGGPIAWSPDGSSMATWSFNAQTQNRYDVWIRPLQGNGKPLPVAVTVADEFPMSFSPDGRWLAYSSNVSGRTEIYAVRVPALDRRQQLSVGGADSAVWSKDGSELWYRTPGGSWVSAAVTERDGSLQVSEPRPRLSGMKPDWLEFAHGERLLVRRSIGKVAPPETLLVRNWKTLLKRPPGSS
jgi:eukaryotic-like serine/threonine-protein kinase